MPKLLLVAVFALALLRSGSHGAGQDRVALFSTISVDSDHTAGDIACAFCTVNLHGDVHGDIAVLFGTVNVDPDRTISGDVAILFSTLHLSDNDRIGGDLAAPLSTLNMPSSATVSGDQVSVPSGSFGLAVLAAPILILAGIIGLLLFLVRRNRYPYPTQPRSWR